MRDSYFSSQASTNKKSAVNQREEELQAEIGRLERSRDEHIETNKIMEARIQVAVDVDHLGWHPFD